MSGESSEGLHSSVSCWLWCVSSALGLFLLWVWSFYSILYHLVSQTAPFPSIPQDHWHKVVPPANLTEGLVGHNGEELQHRQHIIECSTSVWNSCSQEHPASFCFLSPPPSACAMTYSSDDFLFFFSCLWSNVALSLFCFLHRYFALEPHFSYLSGQSATTKGPS